MSAKEFDKLLDADVDAINTLSLVLARCSPIIKVRVVRASDVTGSVLFWISSVF